jgi:rhamnose utilization protein RhaD (predicted bifunctional aldolase and dehydrogenase)
MELDILQTITDLSHEFGTSDYVRGGGGNTSCKDDRTLWVKPSGTTLSGLRPETFVALDRATMGRLYTIETPADASDRESLVKSIMEQAVLPDSAGRASVEAPLHDSLHARYVVHTHPFVVNGMTCAKDGKRICRELFPSSLWLDYIDPGYTLCMQVRQEIQNYKDQNGCEPALIFLKNHGVFVAADEAETIRTLYAEVMSTLTARYEEAGMGGTPVVEAVPTAAAAAAAKQVIRDAMPDADVSIAVGGAFPVASGPISPDHIVYSKSYAYFGKPTVAGVRAFEAEHGYRPQVVAFDAVVCGVADSDNGAGLALALARDGALVEQLAAAFGGIDYMTDAAREFIENWEVESYRKKQMGH